jgi:hypothetical protein
MRTLPTLAQRASQRLSEPRARARDDAQQARREGGASVDPTAVASETQMHFAKCGQSNANRSALEGTEAQGRRSLATLDAVEPDRVSRVRAELERRLRAPGFRANHERLYREMLEQLAPATEGQVVDPGRKRRGRLVFGDDTGEPS